MQGALFNEFRPSVWAPYLYVDKVELTVTILSPDVIQYIHVVFLRTIAAV